MQSKIERQSELYDLSRNLIELRSSLFGSAFSCEEMIRFATETEIYLSHNEYEKALIISFIVMQLQ